MDVRGPANGRDRRPRIRSGQRPSTRGGYTFPRGEHRQPTHGGQARRDRQQSAYVVGSVIVVLALAAFLYVGLNWVTGSGRVAGLAVQPTSTAVAAVVQSAVTPEPSPGTGGGEQTYVVKAGDNPATIAAQFKIRSDELMAANNIDDPQKLQIGQTLKIPTPTGGR